MSTFEMAGRSVGGGRALIVVELGVTHEGDVELAERMVDAAAAAGADAVKVEVIHPDRLVSDRTLDYSFDTAHDGTITVNYHRLLQQVALADGDLARLSRRAAAAGLGFFGTAFDIDSVGLLQEMGACAIKISSGEVNHLPLLEAAAASGLPVIMDSGRALHWEILRAIGVLQGAGGRAIAIMHLPTGYPAPVEKTHLRMIPQLKAETGLPVGLSCHSIGLDAILAAVALGADIVEKTISPDPARPMDEHLMSLDMKRLPELVERVRWIETALGRPRRTLTEQEERERHKFRQSLVAARPLAAGARLQRDDVDFARPAGGILPEHLDLVLGRRLALDVPERGFITWSHLGQEDDRDRARAGGVERHPQEEPGPSRR